FRERRNRPAIPANSWHGFSERSKRFGAGFADGSPAGFLQLAPGPRTEEFLLRVPSERAALVGNLPDTLARLPGRPLGDRRHGGPHPIAAQGIGGSGGGPYDRCAGSWLHQRP